jgi:hypothetical protein
MVPNVPAPLPSGEPLERLVPPALTRYIHSNDLYDIALWGPRDLGFAAWVIKTAKAPVPASTPLPGFVFICVPIRPKIQRLRAAATAVSDGNAPLICTSPTASRQLSFPPHKVTN